MTMPTYPLLTDALPGFARELEELLTAQGELALSAQVGELRIVHRCRCGDDFCATFYTQPKPKGSYGPNHSNIEVTPKQGMIILDLVDGNIMCVEVLFRDEIRDQLHAVLP
ncbi:MAG: hypothetical protein ACLQGT_08850 [Terracidiphilus sp.]